MEFTIGINRETCIKCGRCTKVCPAYILTQDKPKDGIGIQYPETCIKCGHCVAACPAGAVEHSVFPPEKVHKTDRALLPSPEQVMMLIKSRRSNRAFTDKPVPEAMLTQILEAAHRAPTASNMQQISFTVVTDPEKLRAISELTIGTFMSIVRKLKNPLVKPIAKIFMPDVYKMIPRFEKMEQAFAGGKDLVLRDATAVIFIHAPKSNRFGCEDSNLAYQNASLMAESLGVSQFYTGFVYTAIKQDKTQAINKLLGIDGQIHAGMALGIPEFSFPNYIDKKDIYVKKNLIAHPYRIYTGNISE